MRLALKHQILLAPAVVLCLMTLLLGFLQFTYWDMSVKRQQAKALKTAFIALAEADMATQRMRGTLNLLNQAQIPDVKALEQLDILHEHLAAAAVRLQDVGQLTAWDMALLQRSVEELDPEKGLDLAGFDAALGRLGPFLKQQVGKLNLQRESMSSLHREDIDSLVAETTFVTIVVLGIAILVGILLSLAFARHILKRIKVLSDSAARITAGDFSPPPPPDSVRDELDGLTVSINRMTDQLIRVVSAEKLLEGAEEERRRIAMDIHDQTLADLSAVRRALEQLHRETTCPEAAAIEVDLQRAMTNLRLVMDDLHPQTLEILGLPAALESLLEKACAVPGSPSYHFLCDDGAAALRLPRLPRVSVYRIAAEAITNALRHARASQLEVGMELRGETLVVAVEDNGCGFSHAEPHPDLAGGRGLHNIRERARAIGAQVCWRNSRFSTGTRFELALPLKDA